MDEEQLDLDEAYALKSAEDVLRYYRDWAARYDGDFAARMDFQVPRLVAERYAAIGAGPVLDVGAGTGLLAEALTALGVTEVDGIDISPEMLEMARAKGIYRNLFEADVTARLEIAEGTYGGCVSSGTFTFGHVGPDAFDELLRVTAPGGAFAVSIHTGVYETAGFAARFGALADRIRDFVAEEVDFYGPKADGPHKHDRGLIVSFRKR